MGKSQTKNIAGLKTAKVMGVEELQKLHTGSLLSRLQALRSLDESFVRSDWTVEERQEVEAAGLISFKDTERWKLAYADVKAVLATREHVPKNKRPH